MQIVGRHKHTEALVDTGASNNFIEANFIKGLRNNVSKLTTPREVTGAWGSRLVINYSIELQIKYDNRIHSVLLYLIPTKLPRAIVLGLPFLRDNPTVIQELFRVEPQPTMELATLITPREAKKELRDTTNTSFLLWLTASDKVTSPRLSAQVLEEYSDVVVDELPDSRTNDPTATPTIQHYITLKPNTAPVSKRPYRLPYTDQMELEKQLQELIDTGKIFPSDSPFAAPILFVKKKDGTKRLCVDYRGLNDVTIKSKFPLPLIEDVLDRLHGAKIFSKLDLISGYHQVSVHKADQHKTAFITGQGQYSWKVMPFGLTNAPATFQRLMNYVLRDYINDICVVYLDDILIYSKTKEEHQHHIDTILGTLRKHQLFAKRSKCEFFLTEVQFLGHVINAKGIQVDPEKTEAIDKWPPLKTYKDAQRFLGITGYYRRFISDFSLVAKPLHQFAAKKTNWTPECTAAYDQLKHALASPPILLSFDPSKDIVVTTDASTEAIGAILELHSGGTCLGVVAYLSHLLHSHELNWPIREKELYAVIFAFRKWRHYLLGAHIVVRTDHQSLQYLQLGKAHNDNQRVARWWDFLADYNYTITYIAGITNQADALSRPPQVHLNALQVSKFELSDHLRTELSKEYPQDQHFRRLIDHLHNPSQKADSSIRTLISRFTLHDDLLYYTHAPGYPRRLCIPPGSVREQILHNHHDSAIASHPGAYRTLQSLLIYYYWPHMERDIKQYCGTCHHCQTNKHPVLMPPGVFHPLPVATDRWSAINIDFLTGLPVSGGFDAILVVIDRLTKMGHFIRAHKSDTANQTADLLVDHVIKHHGVPTTIVSDQDIVLTSKYWQRFCFRLNIQTEFTTSYNPSSDGQVERLNRTLVEMLRHYCAHHPSAWAVLLPTAEFAYNNSHQVSIQTTPFFANLGYHPRMPGHHNLITGGGTVRK